MNKVAFIINFNKYKWFGGFTVIINLIRAILENKKHKKKFTICLIVANKNVIKNCNISNQIEIIVDKQITNPHICKKIVDKFFLVFFGKTFFLEKKLKKNNIKLISHTNICTGNKSFAKSIVWIPDFQFLYFKKYFSLKYRFLKIINLIIYSKHASKILLSSHNARSDLKKIFLPAYKISTVNSFCFKKIKTQNKLIKNKIKDKYKLPEKFFYFPNQYWIHKNHIIVLKALAVLTKQHKQIVIISTGLNYDYRHPHYFDYISKFIEENNLKKNYLYLGLVPTFVTEYLIKKCVAIINPSKFEGWNTSIEQAKAINKKIILSNIPTHREQNPFGAYYFDYNNYLQLSNIIKSVWYNQNQSYKNKKLNESNKNFIKYGEEFIKILFNLFCNSYDMNNKKTFYKLTQ